MQSSILLTFGCKWWIMLTLILGLNLLFPDPTLPPLFWWDIEPPGDLSAEPLLRPLAWGPEATLALEAEEAMFERKKISGRMKVVSLSSSFVVEAAAAGKAWNRGNGFGGEAFKSLRWVAKKQWFPAPQAHHCDCSSLVRGVQKPPNKNHREWWWWRCFLVLLHYYSGLFCSGQLDYSNNRFSTCLLASVSDFLFLDTKMVKALISTVFQGEEQKVAVIQD